ncbi:MAG: packaging protein, partial [Rhodospirillales bacterium]|nr:packaging protein [Rhodospirillales bacterium]
PSITLYHPLSPSITLYHPLSPSITLYHPLSPSITLYHRKDGRIVKTADDLLSARRYAMMMRRYAQGETAARWGGALTYDSRWIV